MRSSPWHARQLAVLAALMAALSVTAAAAQARSDESRLIVGISAGWIRGGELWQVQSQPIESQTPGLFDIYALRRDIRSDLSLSGQMTYFRGDHLGITGEFTYVGLGSTDLCTLVQASGDPTNQIACAALNGNENSASAATLAGGFVYRVSGRSRLQPYLRAVGGATLMPHSTLLTSSLFYDTDGSLTESLIYDDPNWNEIRPTGTLAVGIASAPSQGYQLRIEARETWLTMESVIGPTTTQTLIPPYRTFYKGFPTIMVGFDIILEKSRGRRY